MSWRAIIRPARPFVEGVARSVRLLTRPRFWFDPQLVASVESYRVPNRHIFYGYYDRNPVSADGNWLLAHSAPSGIGADRRAEMAEVGVFHRNEPQNFLPIGRTKAWNWQQGSRLMWLPRQHSQAIFNCIKEGELVSVVVEVPSGREVIRYPFSIYDLSPDGKWAVGLDFARLHRLRPGYGYADLLDTSQGCLLPQDDGVRLYHLAIPDEPPVVVSVAEMATIAADNILPGSEHYINHLSISPCGEWVFWIHLWVSNGKRYSRAFIASRHLKNSRLLFTKGTASHYAWLNDGKILIYIIVDGVGSFQRIDLQTLEVYPPLAPDLLRDDGHPTVSFDGNNIVIDSYPSRFGDRSLYKVDKSGQVVRRFARFYSPLKLNQDQRCDLHPRWVNATSVAVDCVEFELRCIRILTLRSELK